MPKNALAELPEVFFSTTPIRAAVSRAVAKGTLRQIGPKLYSSNLTEEPEALVRRHLWPLVAACVPGALIVDRTAIESRPASDGSIFVVSDRKRDVELPGITIRSRQGAAPQGSDRPFIGGLFLSSPARALLDNIALSRRRKSDVSRTLTRAELEAWLDMTARRGGGNALNALRDEARQIAPQIGRDTEYAELDRLIGAMLGTRDAKLETGQARARHTGKPFDPARIALFETLHAELRATAPIVRPAPLRNPEASATLAFFEAYFSNFIEGTEFAVDQAADIVFNNAIPRDRPEDAHDVLGTWQIVSDDSELTQTPRNAQELTNTLQRRHAILMAARPDKRPGGFKQEANRAGQTMFVAPELVEGTLAQGFGYYQSLGNAFARAVFMMFMISEVHPFVDGNGRIARIMMNAELVAAGEERIIIPTVYRGNYLAVLKALSLNTRPEPLVRALDFAQKWVGSVDWSSLDKTRVQLDTTHAFTDPGEADERGLGLRLP